MKKIVVQEDKDASEIFYEIKKTVENTLLDDTVSAELLYQRKIACLILLLD